MPVARKIFFTLLGALALAVLCWLSPWQRLYARELTPWLSPTKSIARWKMDALSRAPLACMNWIGGQDADASRKRLISLTFDDGPYPLYTPLLLDVLARYKVHATFFVVGKHVREYPDLIRQIAAGGHEIANHTYTHRREAQYSVGELEKEILATEDAVNEITGKRPHLFRPAGGFMTPHGLATIQRLGYTMCNASINPGDWWQTDPDAVIQSSYRGRSREGVTLMHSGALGIIRALPGYINALKAKGFRFVTLSELAEAVGEPLPECPRPAGIKK